MSTAPAPAPAPTTPTLTAEQFAARPDPGHPEELVEGRIVARPIGMPRHGQICSEVSFRLGVHADEHDLGHVVCGGTGVVTERDPDTVRGADVAYYSFDRVARGPLPKGYLDVVPNLIVEVLSADDRWPRVHRKIGEYLDAGVAVVVVLDDDRRMAHVYTPDGANRVLGADDTLTLPEVLPGFAEPVRRFFD